MKKIIKTIGGHLGNILFCYYSGLYYAKKYNYEYYILQQYNNKKYLNSVFECFIPNYDQIKFLSYNEIPQNIILFKEINAITYTPINDQNENIFIDGYRQSSKYWNDDENFIYNNINIDQNIINSILKTYNNIDFDNCVSMHIRRGDYVEQQQTELQGLETVDYYKNALSCIDKNRQIIIISDDIDWCKQNFIGDNFIFFDKKIDLYEQQYTDFLVQTLCHDNIISNSTFSWWGAYLNRHQDKKIYYPSPFLKGLSGNDIIPNDSRWIKVNSVFYKNNKCGYINLIN